MGPLPSAPSSPSEILTYTASDGYVCHYRRYAASGKVAPTENQMKGHVVCIHGIQSHSSWYERSCQQLAQEGYEVSFLDRRGSGINHQERGDAPGFRRLLDDLAEFVGPLRDRSSAKIFLIAISWGGKLGAALPCRHPDLVDGLALLCPGFCPRVGLSFWDKLRILGARLTQPRSLLPIPLNDPTLFTASPHWQSFIREDPLALREATARLLLESARLDGYLHWVRRRIRLPVLVLLAGQDRIIDNARTRAYVARFSSPDKQIIEYPEAHHTLEFESPTHPFVRDLLGWLDHLGGQKSEVRGQKSAS